jgi:uncharacterized peroxidase-related enzyme
MQTQQNYLFQKLVPIEDSSATPEQSTILEKAKKKVGFIPNMYRTMANLPAFLDTYLHGYNLFRQQSDLTSAEQEVAFLAISKENGCDYCTAAHSTLAANQSGVPADVLSAIRSGEPINDERLAAVHSMAVEINNSRGRPDPEIVNSFFEAGYNETHILAITLAVSVKVLSNYSNHYFDTEVDDAFAAYKVS